MKIALPLLLVALIVLGGCSMACSRPMAATTVVTLQDANYRIVQPLVLGKHSGLSLLGVIPVSPPLRALAMKDLYDKAGIGVGQSVALVNVHEEFIYSYYVLFAIPTVTIQADVIEFTETQASEEGASEACWQCLHPALAR